MGKNLTDLCECIRPQASLLLKKAHEELGFWMSVVSTGRTEEEQVENLRTGVSRTRKSKHLPQPVCKKSHAFDTAPRHLIALKNWAPEHPDWERLGKLGESMGLEWGGRWSGKWRRAGERDYHIVDCPHFQVSVTHAGGAAR